jgi:hypothetical protein
MIDLVIVTVEGLAALALYVRSVPARSGQLQ